MSVESEFLALVDREVGQRLARPTGWAALLGSLPSVYPKTVLDSVDRLGLAQRVVDSGRCVAGGKASFTARLWSEGRLATPHILDGSWWFTDAALDELRYASRQLGRKRGPVLMLGTPSLFHFLRENGVGENPVLVDRSLRGVSCPAPEHAIELDLLVAHPIRIGGFPVVIADPPWYSPETRAFLATARLNADVGSHVIVSVPPLGTRPGIQQEWNELVLWAEGVGLQLIDYQYARLPYVSPPFEQNALRAAGVPPCPLDWRKGDLAVFSCVETNNQTSKYQRCAQENWERVDVGRVTIRVKPPTQERIDGPARLRGLVDGDILPSVSRRHPLVESVSVWTSGNRVFGPPAALGAHTVLRALAAEQRYGVEGGNCATEKTFLNVDLEELKRTLRNIVELEEAELVDWRDRADGKLVYHTA